MRLGDHFHQGLWIFLDKLIPVLYGLGFVFTAVRVLPEKEYGLFVLAYSLVTFATLLNTSFVLQPLVKYISGGSRIADVLTNTAILTVAVWLLFGSILFFLSAQFSNIFNSVELTVVLKYTPLLLAAFFIKDHLLFLCQARQDFRQSFVIDSIYFFISLFMLISYILFNRLDTALDLIKINTFSALMAGFVGVILLKNHIHFSKRPDYAIMKKLIQFGKFSVGSSFGNLVYTQTDTYMIGFLFEPLQVAIYGSAKVFFRFYSILSQSAQMFIFPLSSKLYALGKIKDLRILFEKSVCFIYIILIPLNLFLLFMIPTLFEIAFNGKYTEAVIVLRVLVLGTFFLPWGSIGGSLLLGAGCPKVHFQITWFSVTLNVVLNLFLIPKLGVKGAALATALAMSCGALLVFLKVKEITDFTLAGVWNRFPDFINFARTVWHEKRLDFSEKPL